MSVFLQDFAINKIIYIYNHAADFLLVTKNDIHSTFLFQWKMQKNDAKEWECQLVGT